MLKNFVYDVIRVITLVFCIVTAECMLSRRTGKVKQLANKSYNHTVFLMATFIPTVWMLFANLLQFLLKGEVLLSLDRLVAVATGIVWGGIVAWVINVPQVLYFYRPGGSNKAQKRLFILSALGLVLSLSALVILGILQLPITTDGPVLTYISASLVLIGLLPVIIGCAKPWRYIYITDSRGVYIAYTGEVLQPNTLYRTGLTWRTPALEHHLESEENKIHQLQFKDGTFELRYEATVNFPETPVVIEVCKMDPLALDKAASDFLLKHLQGQCAKFTGMQCMKMQRDFKPVDEYVHVPALEPEGYYVPVRMRWSGKFKLSDI